MSILIFLIILLLLVIIHEAGHFFAAKASNVRVDEFAFGFPPRLFYYKKGETLYAFNLIPLGGYVKIFGENGEEEENNNNKNKRNFASKHPLIKIFILSAGVIMNIILAYILITLSTYLDSNIVVDRQSEEYKTFVNQNRILERDIMILSVSENSPAYFAGLSVGDKIEEIKLNKEDNTGKIIDSKLIDIKNSKEDDITKYLSEKLNDKNYEYNDSISILYKNKENKEKETTIAAVYNLDTENKDRKMIGVLFSEVINVKMTFTESLITGYEKTALFIKLTISGFKDLFVNLFTKGELSKNLAGPVGIVKEVDNAKSMGFSYLLLFSAILSISLAIFNILPFPALDGGRILFVLIEWITRKNISKKWQNILNGGGFILLILLMIFVTIKDVVKLF